jgi:hypothetical protein
MRFTNAVRHDAGVVDRQSSSQPPEGVDMATEIDAGARQGIGVAQQCPLALRQRQRLGERDGQQSSTSACWMSNATPACERIRRARPVMVDLRTVVQPDTRTAITSRHVAAAGRPA